MKTGTWSAAFTVSVDGVEMDITEIPALSLRQILTQVLAGNTCGTVQIDDDLPFAKVS